MQPPVLGYGRQSIDQSDIDAVVSVLRSDFLTQGPTVERFEAALAERVGARHAIAVSSGTAGLHIACLAADIGPGDCGLTAAITFAASANCLALCRSRSWLRRHRLRRAGYDASPARQGADVGTGRQGNRTGAFRGPRACIRRNPYAGKGTNRHRRCSRTRSAALYACGKPVGCGAHADMSVFIVPSGQNYHDGRGRGGRHK